MVWLLVSTSLPAAPKIKSVPLPPLAVMVTVPVPLRVVLALLMISSVGLLFPAAARFKVPELLKLEPKIVSEVVLEMVRVLPEPSVKLSTEPAALSETELPLLMMASVVLLGTPPLQFPAVFQLPLPSVQVVVTLGAALPHKFAAMFQSQFPSIHLLVV